MHQKLGFEKVQGIYKVFGHLFQKQNYFGINCCLKLYDIFCNFAIIKAMANKFWFRTMAAKIKKKSNIFNWSDAILQYADIILNLYNQMILWFEF